MIAYDIRDAFEKTKQDPEIKVNITSCEITSTRSKCQISRGKISFKGKTIPVFIKYSPCQWFDVNTQANCWAMTNDAAKESPNYAETEMFKITNEFVNLGIDDTLVYSYTDRMLKTPISDSNEIYNKASVGHSVRFIPDTFNKGPRKYAMSIMDPLDGYNTLHDILDRGQRVLLKLRLEPGDLRVILFQIMYTIQCMTYVKMAHMDLHFGNIMAKYVPENEGKYREYTYITYAGVVRKAYVPAHYDIKIIDLDGAHKLAAGDGVARSLRRGVPNKNMSTGAATTTNPRTNSMKIMFGLKGYERRGSIRKSEIAEMTNKHGKIPYVNKKLTTTKHPIMKYRNKYMTNQYGLFVHENDNNPLELNNGMISRPSIIVDNIAKHFTTKPEQSDILYSLSQVEIFSKIPSVKAPKNQSAEAPKVPSVKAPKVPSVKAPPRARTTKVMDKIGSRGWYKALVGTVSNILLVHKDDIMNLRHVPKKFVMRKQDMPRFVKNKLMVVDVENNVIVPVTQKDTEAYVIAGEKLWMGAMGRLYVKIVPGLDVVLNDDKAWYMRPTNTPKLARGINDVCGPPRRGRPTKQCSALLKKMREKCERNKDMVFKKRQCVVVKTRKTKKV